MSEIEELKNRVALLLDDNEQLRRELAVDKMHAEFPDGCPVCTHMEIEQLLNQLESSEAEIARQRAGEDETPLDEAVWPTAGQEWHILLSLPAEKRIARLERWIRDGQTADRCFVMNHEGEVALLRQRLSEKESEVDDKSRLGHAVADAWKRKIDVFEKAALEWQEHAEVAEAENERLREWQRAVCDEFGYDAADAGNADEVLAYLPFWRGEAAGYSEALAAAEAKVRAVEALADKWEAHGGAAHPQAIAELRAALADVPAEPELCGLEACDIGGFCQARSGCPYAEVIPPGLVISDDGSLLNWRGVNYVRQDDDGN